MKYVEGYMLTGDGSASRQEPSDSETENQFLSRIQDTIQTNGVLEGESQDRKLELQLVGHF